MGVIVKYDKMCKHIGNKYLLFRPILVLHDVELIKSVLVKDFDHFTDRRAFEMDTNSLGTKILSNMMTSLKGEQWKQVRSAMSPAFTSGKLKAMAPLINKVGDELSEFLAVGSAMNTPHWPMFQSRCRTHILTI